MAALSPLPPQVTELISIVLMTKPKEDRAYTTSYLKKWLKDAVSSSDEELDTQIKSFQAKKQGGGQKAGSGGPQDPDIPGVWTLTSYCKGAQNRALLGKVLKNLSSKNIFWDPFEGFNAPVAALVCVVYGKILKPMWSSRSLLSKKHQFSIFRASHGYFLGVLQK